MLVFGMPDEGSNDILKHDISNRLSNGQVGILPTDTVYGLVCIADNEEGRRRICEMKERDGDKPMQYLLSDLDCCAWLDVEVTEDLRKLAKAFWPGPLTVVVTNSKNQFVGIRVPNHEFVCSLIDEIGKPLTATSANVSGQDPKECLEHEFKDLNGEPDFAMLGDEIHSPSSTVVRIHPNGEIELLREGVITEVQIRETLA